MSSRSVPPTGQGVARVPDHVAVGELPQETVLLNLDKGEYFTLNEVASRMLALAQEHSDLDVVFGALLAEFDVESERLRADLSIFMDQLASNGLVEVSNGSA